MSKRRKMTPGERVREARLARGWTQEDLAHQMRQLGQQLGVRSISRFESNARRFHSTTVERLAKALGLTETFILHGEDPPATTPSEAELDLVIMEFRAAYKRAAGTARQRAFLERVKRVVESSEARSTEVRRGARR